MASLKQIERFHRNRRKIPGVIRKHIDDHEIVHGARALNKHLPSFLDRPTQDFDIFSPTPKKDAREVERALDKKFKGDFFKTEAGAHPGTFRVKEKFRDEEVADFTKPERKIPNKKIGGIRYATPKHFKAQIKRTLKDKSASFRHAKDRDALNRIKVAEKLKKKGKRRKKRSVFGF